MKLRSKWAAIVALAAAAIPGVWTANASARALPSLASITSWRTVIDDSFDSGGVPSHWRAYNGPYRSGSCALPSHNVVSGGYLHLKFYYEPSSSAGKCGAGWYAGGLTLGTSDSSVSQQITIRFRVVQSGGVSAHRIIPMRSPDAGGLGGGEEDYCESSSVSFCSTFLHWRDMSGRDRKKYFLDLTQWHTYQFTRNAYRVTATIDGTTAFDFLGTSTSLPATLHHVVLQQECIRNACPTSTTGQEDIQIDWIKVENPA